MIICICLIVVLAVALTICMLPWQTTSSSTFHGFALSADGSALEECDITLNCTKLRYLFREDAYKYIELSVPGYSCDTSDHQTAIPYSNHPSLECEMIRFLEYNSDTNSYSDNIELYLSFDGEWCLIKYTTANEVDYFIGSKDSNTNLQQIINAVISD